MSYSSKTKEELIELLEERDEEIRDISEERDEAVEEGESLSADLSSLESQLHENETKEELLEKTFNAGYESHSKKEEKLKAWLNYKIGARI